MPWKILATHISTDGEGTGLPQPAQASYILADQSSDKYADIYRLNRRHVKRALVRNIETVWSDREEWFRMHMHMARLSIPNRRIGASGSLCFGCFGSGQSSGG
jgi:hypothetical protein